MERQRSRNRDLLERARVELAEADQRLSKAKALVDTALEDEQQRQRVRRFEPSSAAAARSVASRMALAGKSRHQVEGRLRGTVPDDLLDEILEELAAAKSVQQA